MAIAGPHKNATGGIADGLGDYISRCAAAGKQFIVVCPEDAALAAQVADAGGIAVYRKNEWSGEPRYDMAPDTAALDRWQRILPLIPDEIAQRRETVWLQYTIEPDRSRADWVLQFAYHLSVIANADGYKVVGPNWSTGTPEPDAWESEGGLMFLRYCAKNRDRCALGLHEYSLNDDILHGSPWLVGRFQFVLDVCDDHGIAHPRIMVTEFGWHYDDVPGATEAMRQLTEGKTVTTDEGTDEYLPAPVELYGDKIPFAVWTLGTWEEAPDLPGKVAPLMPLITDYMVEHGTDVEPPGEEPMETVEEFVWQLGTSSQLVPLNPVAALGKAIRADGRSVLGPETDGVHDGRHVRVQLAGDPATGERFVYWADYGEWSNVYVQGDPAAAPFQSPVGTKAERESGDIWPGDWVDATGFATRYQIVSGGNYHRHTGADLNLNTPNWNADKGMAVHATRDGVVIYAERVPSPSTWGRLVVIRHEYNGDTIHSRYAHMGSMLVEKGQRVRQGDVIGTIGGAEFNLPDHLHFDISHSGILETNPRHWPGDNLSGVLDNYLDPKAVLEGKADALRTAAQPGPDGTIGLVGSLQYNAISKYAPYNERAVDGIEYIVIHHSAGNPSNPPASIAEGHINRNGGGEDGWPTIGYHYYIGGDGQIYRTNLLETHSFHAGNANGISVGVCLAGSFMNGAEPTDAQLASCRALVDWLRARLPDVQVMKHRDFMATACPGDTWERWWSAATGQSSPTPPAVTVDLLPYIRGDGRLYEVRHSSGSQERFQTQTEGPYIYQTKNAAWERFRADADHIWRDIDTSPGPAPSNAERPGADRFYVQREPGQDAARWCKRHMSIGETFTGPGHTVQFYYKSDCAESAANSGSATNRITFVDHHDSVTWNSITVSDVVELTNGTERWWFARDVGMVAWSSPWGFSAISEVHAPGARPDNERETICL